MTFSSLVACDTVAPGLRRASAMKSKGPVSVNSTGRGTNGFHSGVRRRKKRRQHHGLCCVEPVRGFAVEQRRGCADPLELAAKVDEVQVSFEDLRLRPARFEGERKPELSELLDHRAWMRAREPAQNIGSMVIHPCWPLMVADRSRNSTPDQASCAKPCRNSTLA